MFKFSVLASTLMVVASNAFGVTNVCYKISPPLGSHPGITALKGTTLLLITVDLGTASFWGKETKNGDIVRLGNRYTDYGYSRGDSSYRFSTPNNYKIFFSVNLGGNDGAQLITSDDETYSLQKIDRNKCRPTDYWRNGGDGSDD